MKRPAMLLMIGLAASACSELGKPAVVTPERTPPPAAPDAAPPEPDAASFDLWNGLPDVSGEAPTTPAPSQERDVVYAHSGSDLFRVDPETMDVQRVGNFTVPNLANPGAPARFIFNMTDIAVDRAGRIIGLTFGQILNIDPTNANCRVLAPVPMGDRFNGLSWIRSEQGPEQLVASSVDGSLFRIDPATGAGTLIGELGGGRQSSGDLVSVASHGTLLTVKGATPTAPDQLARVDPTTGAATIIGPTTGFQKIWGLGFWKNRVFGFTQTGEFILIDPTTGASTLVRRFPAFPFWGAGVTTAVTVID